MRKREAAREAAKEEETVSCVIANWATPGGRLFILGYHTRDFFLGVGGEV
jgi:hypothetical protein